MWARIVKERFGSSNVRSMSCRFHVQTAGSSLTAQSIDNNVVRTTLQALAAVLGGAQSLHTNARDEALALPTAEIGAPRPPNPADPRLRGGRHRDRRPARRQSTPSRSLTDALEAAALDSLAEIDALGGTARRHRGGLPAAADPGVGLSGAAGDRGGGADRRRASIASGTMPRVAGRRSSASTPRRSAIRSRGSGGSGRSATRRRGRRR